MNMNEEIASRSILINEMISPFFPTEGGYQERVIKAMNYSIRLPGKRLRPMLMYETFCLFQGEGKSIEPFMAAIEMIHTYSLIHDDLPAMDDDSYRRGKLSNHKVFGEDIAILAGDGLLNYAFETVLLSLEQKPLNENIGRALQVFAHKSGIYGMVGGQVVDVENEGCMVSKEQLNFIYELKTAALIESAMTIGAILAGATLEEVSLIEKVARSIGLAFQIEDDILDITSSTEVLGKSVNSDMKNNKCTYVTLYGMRESQEKVKELTAEAMTLLNTLNNKNEFLNKLLEFLVIRKK